MSYPEGLPPSAFCQMEGCRWVGGVCTQCGQRLRCICGRFVMVEYLAAHERNCPTFTRLDTAATEAERDR